MFLRLGRCFPLALSLALALTAQPRHAPDHHWTGFPAIFDNYTNTPPDTQGAVGIDDLMTMVNGQVLVQSRSGEPRNGYPIPLTQFWSGLGTFTKLFDPRLLYDAAAKRWIASAGANPGAADAALLLAVSKGEDPTGDWYRVRIPVGPDGDWADYPVIGFNRNWIVLSANLLVLPPKGAYARTAVYVFDKAALYGSGKESYKTFSDTQGEMAPAVDLDGTSDSLYFVQALAGTSNGRVRISRLDGPVGGESFVPGAFAIDLPDTWGVTSPGGVDFAPQSGSWFKVDTGDSRLQNCVLRAGAAWCAHTVFLPAAAPKRASVGWFAADLGARKVLQSGNIDDPSGAQFFAFPSITVNRSGDALIGYSRFTANEYPSAAFSIRVVSDPANGFPLSAVSKPGEAPYVGRGADEGSNRWGDFSSTVVDPVDGVTFWSLQEYAASPTQHYPGRWGTWWSQITPGHGGR